jgi:hypothetical protein
MANVNTAILALTAAAVQTSIGASVWTYNKVSELATRFETLVRAVNDIGRDVETLSKNVSDMGSQMDGRLGALADEQDQIRWIVIRMLGSVWTLIALHVAVCIWRDGNTRKDRDADDMARTDNQRHFQKQYPILTLLIIAVSIVSLIVLYTTGMGYLLVHSVPPECAPQAPQDSSWAIPAKCTGAISNGALDFFGSFLNSNLFAGTREAGRNAWYVFTVTSASFPMGWTALTTDLPRGGATVGSTPGMSSTNFVPNLKTEWDATLTGAKSSSSESTASDFGTTFAFQNPLSDTDDAIKAGDMAQTLTSPFVMSK